MYYENGQHLSHKIEDDITDDHTNNQRAATPEKAKHKDKQQQIKHDKDSLILYYCSVLFFTTGTVCDLFEKFYLCINIKSCLSSCKTKAHNEQSARWS